LSPYRYTNHNSTYEVRLRSPNELSPGADKDYGRRRKTLVKSVRILENPIKASSHYKASGMDKELEIGKLTPAEEQNDAVPSVVRSRVLYQGSGDRTHEGDVSPSFTTMRPSTVLGWQETETYGLILSQVSFSGINGSKEELVGG